MLWAEVGLSFASPATVAEKVRVFVSTATADVMVVSPLAGRSGVLKNRYPGTVSSSV